jgi:glycosyltransferase involved in cell wall biosynthesis
MNSIHQDYEIVFINDGSQDSTLSTMRRLQDEQPNIQVQDVLTTRTSYDVNNKNPNRFWNKK